MIVIYGPAGVGKSTQAQILADKLNRKWLSAGQIIRDSERFKEYTEKGAMIPEDILVGLINEKVEEAKNDGFDVVFDGQPGSPEQIKYWVETGLMSKVECVLVLRAPEEDLINRLSGRGREDDNINVWKTKIQYFEQKICSFLTEIKAQNVPIYDIDGQGDIEAVSARVWEVVSNK